METVDISNTCLRARISLKGSELVSLCGKEEYIWQGAPGLWKEHAPLLFPIVGRHKNDCYSLDGEKYRLGIHGFARSQTSVLVEKTANSVTLEMTDSEETLKCFPFHFQIFSKYSLKGKCLAVERCIRNNSQRPMPFCIGEHFGFNLAASGKIYGFISFEKDIDVQCCGINENHYITSRERLCTRDIRLDKSSFERGTKILLDIGCKKLSLRDGTGRSILAVEYDDYPALALWSRPGAPYIAIEPICGTDSFLQDSDEFQSKAYIQILSPGCSTSFTTKISITDIPK